MATNGQRLLDKVAIVTGAGAGIGEAIAHKFAAKGAKLVLNGLPDDPVDDVAAAIRKKGGTAVAYVGDVSEEEHARACVDRAVKELIDSAVTDAKAAPSPSVDELLTDVYVSY